MKVGGLFTASGAFRAWVTTLLVIAGFGLALGLTVGYVRKVDRQADLRDQERAREICGLISVFDDAYQRSPPQTAVGRRAAVEMHAYRRKLGCP